MNNGYVSLSGTGNIAQRLIKAAKTAQAELSVRALADCNRYCKIDTGNLARSSYAFSKINNGTLVWVTPYARHAYYLGTASKRINPYAEKMWAHKAASINFANWRDFAASRLAKALAGKE